MKRRNIHRAWIMLVGCCLLQGGSMGLVNNCRGVFLTPVTSALGLSMGGFTLTLTISGLCSCLLMPVVSRIFERIDSRILLGGCAIGFSVSVIGMGWMRTLPGFTVMGILQGVFSTFLMFFPAPFILGNWFHKRSGFAIGLCSAFSGVIGIIFNPAINAVIQRFGWQGGYYTVGVLAFLMMFPVSVFLLRLRPADVGLTPYGADDAPAAETPALSGPPASVVRRSVGLWTLILAAFLCSCVGNLNSYLSPMGIQWGYGASVGAALISVSMAGNVASKFCLGPIYDRFGLGKALTFGLSVSAFGLCLLLIPVQSIRLIGAFFYGFVMGTANIMPSIAVKDIYGLRSYGENLSLPTMSVSLGSAAVYVSVGLLIDTVGAQSGYMLCLRLALAMVAVIGVCYIVSIRSGRRLSLRFAAE